MRKNKVVIQKSLGERLGIWLKIILLVCVSIFILNLLISIFSSSGILNKIFKIPVANIDAGDGINKNYNGGLTREDFDKEQSDPNCPTLDDVYDDMYIIDTDSLVCFYREIETEGKTIYPNIVFIKTDKGLVYNGATNMVGVQTNYIFAIVNYNVYQDFEKKPTFDVKSTNSFGEWYNNASNLCLFDSGNACFWKLQGVPLITGGISGISARNYRMILSRDYINKEIVNKYFLKFYNDNVEIFMQSEKTISADFNAFYNYVYQSALKYDYGKYNQGVCSVDVSAPLTIYPIPETEQSKYPMANGDNFHCYKVKTYLNCYYEKLDFENPIKVPEDNIKDEPIADCAEEPKAYATLNITLKTDSNYSKEYLGNVVKNSPVVITFTDSKGNLAKTVTINESNFDFPYCKLACALDNGKYTYKIVSNDLAFSTNTGSITIDGSSSVVFSYSYSDTTKVSVSLKASNSDFDYSTLKFDSPIILTFKSDKKTYSFSFKSLADLMGKQTQNLTRGSYTVSLITNNSIYMNDVDIIVSATKNVFEFSFTESPTDLSYEFNFEEHAGGSSSDGTLSCDSFIVIKSDVLEQRFNGENFFIGFSIYASFTDKNYDFEWSKESLLSYGGSFSDGVAKTLSDLADIRGTGEYVIRMSFYNTDKTYNYSVKFDGSLTSSSFFEFTLTIK